MNCGHEDFQSSALPTELSRHVVKSLITFPAWYGQDENEFGKYFSKKMPLFRHFIVNVICQFKCVLLKGYDALVPP